jgi:hypothetical protein
MMDLVKSSFLEKNISPLQRINKIWTVVFCLRYWRLWLTCDRVYTLGKNFISSNAYLSIEINAHSLLLLIRKCRAEKNPELLLPWLLGSQQCEKNFRQLRSLCPVGLNQPNVTEYQFLDRARKIDVNLVLQQQGAKDGVIYRRDIEKSNRMGGSSYALQKIVLPSDEDISNELKICMQIAKKKMNDLGIELDGRDTINFQFDPSYGKTIRNRTISEIEFEERDEEQEDRDDGDDCAESEVEQDPPASFIS